MVATIRLAFKSKHRGTHAARVLAQLLPPPPARGVCLPVSVQGSAFWIQSHPFLGALACVCSSAEGRGLTTTTVGFTGSCNRSLHWTPLRDGSFIFCLADETHSLPKLAAATVAVMGPGIKLQQYKQSLLCTSKSITYPWQFIPHMGFFLFVQAWSDFALLFFTFTPTKK